MDRARFNNLKMFLGDMEGLGLTAFELRALEIAKELHTEMIEHEVSATAVLTDWRRSHPSGGPKYAETIHKCLNYLQEDKSHAHP